MRSATPPVAVIGLGVMGRPIAENLARAGLEVVGYTRTPARLGSEPPVPLAATAAEAIACAGVVVLTVPGLDDAYDVLGDDDAPAKGREGVRRGDARFTVELAGKVVVLSATVDPAGSRAFGEALAAAGAEYVEAPVAGSAAQAREGSLVVLASAREGGVVDRLEPMFAAIGRRTVWCGPPPTAMTVKLANNLVQIGLFEAFAEATTLIERAGVDLALFYEVLMGGALANRVLEAKTRLVLSGHLEPQAPLKHVHKDLGLIAGEASRLDLTLPGVDAARGTFTRAREAGLGDLDAMAILNVLGRTGTDRCTW